MQGSSWYETDAQQPAFADGTTLELQSTDRANVADCTASCADQSSTDCGQSTQQQRTCVEPRSSNALDTLLDELKLYSETNKPDDVPSVSFCQRIRYPFQTRKASILEKCGVKTFFVLLITMSRSNDMSDEYG